MNLGTGVAAIAIGMKPKLATKAVIMMGLGWTTAASLVARSNCVAGLTSRRSLPSEKPSTLGHLFASRIQTVTIQDRAEPVCLIQTLRL